MNVADYIVEFLAKKGVKHIFMLTGGQAMFLNDAVQRNKKITPIFSNHEQAAGMAADAYGKGSENLGVAMVTSGAGVLNILNGVGGAWADSAPMMVISGQANSSLIEYMEKNPIRQFGIQGIYIKPYTYGTKYYQRVDDPAKILYYLEKAYYLATTGRTGPVWIDVPLDIQRMQIPSKFLKRFEIPKEKSSVENLSIQKDVSKIILLLKKSIRPVLYLGQGVKIAHAQKELDKLFKLVQPAILTTRLGLDLVDSMNPLFAGRPGLYGDRYANFAIQNADLIIAVGARLDAGAVGYDAEDWGRNAKIVVVDVDPAELKKPGVRTNIKVLADAKIFLQLLIKQLKNQSMPSYDTWLKTINTWKNKYPTVLPEYKNEKPVNTYYFSKVLSSVAKNDDQILVDASSCFHVVCQAWEIKKGQTYLTTGGLSSIGYWAASIGLALSHPEKRTIIITGDGSFQLNIQELATIKQNNIPVKIFVFNNNGYLLIRHTQQTHMGGRLMGESPQTGLWIPNILDLAKTYQIEGVRIKSSNNLAKKITKILSYKGPIICEVMTPVWQAIVPRVSSHKNPDGSMVSKSFENLFPFLDKKEFLSNMLGKLPKEYQ